MVATISQPATPTTFSFSNAVSGSSSTMRMRLTICLRLSNSIETPMALPTQRTTRHPVPRPRKGRTTVPLEPHPDKSGKQRIAKLLARAGIASRREVERLIADGRIALNGEKITTPATLLTDLSGVTYDGRPLRPAASTRLFRFYTPPGTLT